MLLLAILLNAWTCYKPVQISCMECVVALCDACASNLDQCLDTSFLLQKFDLGALVTTKRSFCCIQPYLFVLMSFSVLWGNAMS